MFIETTPFGRGLRDHTLPGHSALTFLHGVAVIHATIERSLDSANASTFQGAALPGLRLLPLLRADLETLRAESLPAIRPAVLSAMAVSNQVVLLALDDPALLGFFREMLELQAEAALFDSDFAAVLGVRPGRLAYLWPRDPASVQAVHEAFAALSEDSASADRIEQGGELARKGIDSFIRELYPFDAADLRVQVTAMNPEAGDHAMPTDAAEIALAIRASTRAFEQFPYLALRFGERGRRFSNSDSCWLLTLAAQDESVIRKSIAWLLPMLSTRGIPGILLEAQLAVLADEIDDQLPHLGAGARKLRAAATSLIADRESVIPSQVVARLVNEYESRLHRIDSRFGPVVPLLASARADELLGAGGAFEATRQWLHEAGPPGSEWPAVVAELSAELRKLRREVTA